MGTSTEGMTMAEFDDPSARDLRDSDFAYVDRSGERHLPIHDPDHVRNAIARFDQTDFQSKTAKHAAATRIMAAAKRHDIEVDDTSDVAAKSGAERERRPRNASQRPLVSVR